MDLHSFTFTRRTFLTQLANSSAAFTDPNLGVLPMPFDPLALPAFPLPPLPALPVSRLLGFALPPPFVVLLSFVPLFSFEPFPLNLLLESLAPSSAAVRSCLGSLFFYGWDTLAQFNCIVSNGVLNQRATYLANRICHWICYCEFIVLHKFMCFYWFGDCARPRNRSFLTTSLGASLKAKLAAKCPKWSWPKGKHERSSRGKER